MDEFAAIADPTRRAIIEKLALQGRLSASQISDQFPISPQAISQHLKILREAKVVFMDKRAQQRIYRINLDAMHGIENWAKQMAQLWNERFDAIEALLEEENSKTDEDKS